jgi:hypothetical protein
MPTLQFRCAHCSGLLQIQDTHARQYVKCRRCGQTVLCPWAENDIELPGQTYHDSSQKEPFDFGPSDWDRSKRRATNKLIAGIAIGGSVLLVGILLLISFSDKLPTEPPRKKLATLVRKPKTLEPEPSKEKPAAPAKAKDGLPDIFVPPNLEPEPEPEAPSKMDIQLAKEKDQAEKKEKARKLIFQHGYKSTKEPLIQALEIFESLLPTFGDSRSQQLEKARSLVYIFHLNARTDGRAKTKSVFPKILQILKEQRFFPNEISQFQAGVREDISSLVAAGNTERLRDLRFGKKKD